MAQLPVPVQLLAELAYSLQATLTAPRADMQPLLSPTVEVSINYELNRNPFDSVNNGNEITHLDVIGTLLWNTCTELSVSYAGNPSDLSSLARVRAIAFAVLNHAVPANLLGRLRALNLALSSAQICLVNQQSDVAMNILSAAAQRLASVQSDNELNSVVNRAATIRYYLLRVRLAWLQGRVDIAELFFSKVPQPILSKDREMIFELCFVIGDSALALRQSETAVIWLQRASDHLQLLTISAEPTFPAFDDWNLVVRHSLAVACTQLKTPQYIALRSSEMSILRELYPSHPAVDLIDLSIGHNSPGVDELLQGLSNLVERIDLTCSNMPIIFQFVRCLNQTGGSEDGMKAIRILLMHPLPSCEWAEKCFVSFVLLLAKLPGSYSDCNRVCTIRSMVDVLQKRGCPSLSTSAAQATITCLWTMIGAAITKQDHWAAQQWLLICVMPMIFQNCSAPMQVTIHKKLIACYLHTSSTGDARQLINRGLVQSQSDCQRMYLSYKLSLLEGKDVSRFFCLGFPSNPVPQKQMSLLSCVMEAQRQKKPEQVLDCLDQFIKCLVSDDIYHSDFSASEHYMFAIALLSEELSKGFNQQLAKFIETVLESVLSYVKENSVFEGGDQEVSVTQLQWLYFAAYKIALQLSKSSGFQWTRVVLNYSKELALQYRRIAFPDADSKAPRPHLFAVAYLGLLVASLEARSEVDSAKKKSYYEIVRASYRELDGLLGWDDGEEESDHDSHVKEDRHHDNAQFFDFEAAMHLEKWDDVIEICESHNAFPKSGFYAPIMDLALQLSPPPAIAVRIIKQIFIKLAESESENNSPSPATPWQHNFRVLLPRYLQCLFSLAIAPRSNVTGVPEPASPNIDMVDADVAERVLDQIITMAEDETNIRKAEESESHGVEIETKSELSPSQKSFLYPPPELIRTAHMAFNQACAFYQADRDDDCMRWADKAISVARLVPGSAGTKVVDSLQNRLNKMIGT